MQEVTADTEATPGGLDRVPGKRLCEVQTGEWSGESILDTLYSLFKHFANSHAGNLTLSCHCSAKCGINAFSLRSVTFE